MDNNYEPQEETVEVAGFITKTFEILNVHLILFRIKIFQELFTGHQQDLSSSSRTSISFNKWCYPNTSGTTRSTPLSGNWTCTASTNRERNTQRASLATLYSKKTESIFFILFQGSVVWNQEKNQTERGIGGREVRNSRQIAKSDEIGFGNSNDRKGASRIERENDIFTETVEPSGSRSIFIHEAFREQGELFFKTKFKFLT